MIFNSEFAETMFRTKYLLEGENEPDQAVERVANTVKKYYPSIYDKVKEYLNNQVILPGGGIWRAAGNPVKNISYVNCTTLDSPKDNLESIFEALYWWAKFSAFGQGEGIDLSNLRPKGSTLNNTARTSTGAISFMKIFDSVLSVISQKGRRGASLLTIKDTYPDFRDFCLCKTELGVVENANISIQFSDEFMNAVKNKEKWKLHWSDEKQTIEAEEDAEELFDFFCKCAHSKGEPGALFFDTIRGESNSDALGFPVVCANACSFSSDTLITTRKGLFRITDLIGKEVEIFDGKNWTLVDSFRKTGNDELYRVTLNNGAYFDATTNHRFFLESGEERKTFKLNIGDYLEYANIDKIERKNGFNKIVSIEKLNRKEDVYCCTVPTTGKFLVNNGILTGNSEQNLDPYNVCLLLHLNLSKVNNQLEDLTETGILMLDAFRMAEYDENRSPSPIQKEKLLTLPRIGLGMTGLADYFIDRRIIYGSNESIQESKKIFSTMARVAYKTSYDIAKKNGKSFKYYDKEKYKQSNYVKRLLDENIIEDRDLDYQAHVCKLTIAPTGTASIIGNCGGSGIEPLFSRYMVRRERTSGEWKEWFIFNEAITKELKKRNLEINRENANSLTEDYWVTAHSLDPLKKIKLMSAIQKYIDSSISVTYNLPNNATVEDVKSIYINGWEAGLKGIAVYREGSREGVIITEENYEESKKYKKKAYIRRPKSIPGKVFKYKDYTMIIGIVNDKPYEIFGGQINNGFEDGEIIKVKKGVYELNEINILDNFNDKSINAITRLVSLSLRHGVQLQFVVDQLEKEADFFDITKFFARTLKKFLINEEVLSDNLCPACKAEDTLIYQNGCKLCIKCGWSACS